MKSKKISFKFLVLQMLMLAGLLLTQGCATGDCPVCLLNWPYGQPLDKPLILPVQPGTSYPEESSDSILLPVDMYTTEPSDFVSVPYEPVAEPSSQVYVVKKGDTLSLIASMYGTSWKRLAEFNSLSNPNKLFVGQKLDIPGSLHAVSVPVHRAVSPSKTSSSYSAPSKTSGKTIKQGASYVIQRGDSLSLIAKRSGLTVTELKAANALTSNQIVAGKSLSIPKKGDVSVKLPSEFVAQPVKKSVSASSLAPMADLAPIEESSSDADPVAKSASAPVYEHVLYPGETLDDVARQYGSTKEDIMELNAISDPDSIKPGSKLLVPIPE